MATESSNKNSGRCMFASPVRMLGFSVVGTLFLSALVTVGFYHCNATHGSLGLLTPPTPLELKGQEIYYQEGCQYCHTQTLRPIAAEVKRYADPKAYGLAQLPDINEYNYETPAMRGSFRIGPDLSRIAGSKLDDPDALKAILKGDREKLSGLYHNYKDLFQSDRDMVPVFLAWKVRMMMQSRTPFSDNYQKSVFRALAEKTRGDALVAYLRSLGRRQSKLASKFYK